MKKMKSKPFPNIRSDTQENTSYDIKKFLKIFMYNLQISKIVLVKFSKINFDSNSDFCHFNSGTTGYPLKKKLSVVFDKRTGSIMAGTFVVDQDNKFRKKITRDLEFVKPEQFEEIFKEIVKNLK